jgi:hypothetical protein
MDKDELMEMVREELDADAVVMVVLRDPVEAGPKMAMSRQSILTDGRPGSLSGKISGPLARVIGNMIRDAFSKAGGHIVESSEPKREPVPHRPVCPINDPDWPPDPPTFDHEDDDE